MQTARHELIGKTDSCAKNAVKHCVKNILMGVWLALRETSYSQLLGPRPGVYSLSHNKWNKYRITYTDAPISSKYCY